MDSELKIEWESPDPAGRSAIRAVPEEYDATPELERLMIDGLPTNVSADRFGVAAALAFGRWAAGHLTLPFAVSPTAGEAIQEFFAPTRLVVEPIEYAARALPIGLGSLILSTSESFSKPPQNVWGEPRKIQFHIKRSDSWAGTLSNLDSYTSCSNAWVFPGEDCSVYEGILPYLSWAVLFAESLQADSIQLPSLGELTLDEESSLRALLASCRLGLS